VPATSAAHNRLLFFFFAAAVYSTNEANKAGSMCRQAVYILRCLCIEQHVLDTNAGKQVSSAATNVTFDENSEVSSRRSFLSGRRIFADVDESVQFPSVVGLQGDLYQRSLTEGEGSVQLTFLYRLV
jgi:hypothetical protein